MYDEAKGGKSAVVEGERNKGMGAPVCRGVRRKIKIRVGKERECRGKDDRVRNIFKNT